MSSRNIVVYEHDKLTLQSNKLTPSILELLERYYGENGVPYYTLIHKGVKFHQYVGVLQVGNTTIEVLPKTDRSKESEKVNWRKALIQMLRITTGIEAVATSTSNLQLQSNSIFDLYLELFVKECEQLTHQGLVKKYRKTQSNHNSLKGRLHIPGQVRHNLIHKERFYIEYNKYDQNHLLNQILKTTLVIIDNMTIAFDLRSRVKRLLLYFESVESCSPNSSLFDRIVLNRKTQKYRQALNIVRLILLNYHPDISRGENHVLALMFDMNQLWEHYMGKLFKNYMSNQYDVYTQKSAVFLDINNSKRKLRPDIILVHKQDPVNKIIFDTKWKIPDERVPSDGDIKQMFAYNRLFNCNQSILLYPGPSDSYSGHYKADHGGKCGVMMVEVLDEKGRLRSADIFDKFNIITSASSV